MFCRKKGSLFKNIFVCEVYGIIQETAVINPLDQKVECSQYVVCS